MTRDQLLHIHLPSSAGYFSQRTHSPLPRSPTPVFRPIISLAGDGRGLLRSPLPFALSSRSSPRSGVSSRGQACRPEVRWLPAALGDLSPVGFKFRLQPRLSVRLSSLSRTLGHSFTCSSSGPRSRARSLSFGYKAFCFVHVPSKLLNPP